ncbi:hypothetical protein R1flu_001971 [Riccia fluitans]|uniref:Transposase n=1 Tax=Riccia fluitans TaxID=41844 RepID=A0ABD1Y570_9MARC
MATSLGEGEQGIAASRACRKLETIVAARFGTQMAKQRAWLQIEEPRDVDVDAAHCPVMRGKQGCPRRKGGAQYLIPLRIISSLQ